MKSILKIKIIFFCLIAVLSGCGDDISQFNDIERYQKYFELTEEDWLLRLSEIGIKSENLNNTVLLITHSTNCPDCLQELALWNNIYLKNNQDDNIYLIVVERHQGRFRNFLDRNDLTLNAFRDGNLTLPQHDMIPFVPIKIFFNDQGEKARFHSIGGDDHLNLFLDEFADN